MKLAVINNRCLKGIAACMAAMALVLAAPVAKAEPASQCTPVLGGAIANLAYECLNDSTMLLVQENNFEWQYAIDAPDSDLFLHDGDGVNGNQLGTTFEMYGMAFKETPTHLYFVVSGELSLAGDPHPNAQGGTVTHGDLFLNLTANDFKTASDNQSLYGIRYAPLNDSGAPEVGVYKDVSAKSVTSTNRGFASLAAYQTKITDLGSIPDYGDFDMNQTYYASNISLNVIKSGELLGPIEMLSPPELEAVGYDPTRFNSEPGQTPPPIVAFRFAKELIIDECGVIGGDGTSCLDCDGVACGDAVEDQCGICNGDGTSCLDCAGNPFGEAVVDQCGVCDGDGTSCLDCAGIPFGTNVVDQCGICGGTNECLDCEGNPFGGLVYDICGVCDGDGTSCLDCAGNPFGDAVEDQCGVCDGDGTSCLDCLGNPNGDATFDQCGVCDGDGTSCLDCAGTPNGDAQLDECGVCEGDGLSCLQCVETDNKEVLISYDSNALDQRNAAWRATNALNRQARRNSRPRLVRRAQVLNKRANDLYHEAWTQTWQLPLVALDCGAAVQCVEVSFVGTLESLDQNALALRRVGRRAHRLAKRASGRSIFRRGIRRQINRLYQRSRTLAEGLPLSSSVCG